MSFDAKERAIIDYAKANGKSRAEVEKAIVNYRAGVQPKAPTATKKVGGVVQAVKDTGSALKTTLRETQLKQSEALDAGVQGKQSLPRSFAQAVGIGAGGLSRAVGDVVVGAAKAVLPERAEQAVKSGVASVVKPIAESETVKNVVSRYESLDEKSKRDVDALLGVGALASEFIGVGQGKRLASPIVRGVKAGIEGVEEGVDTAVKAGVRGVETVANMPKVQGAIQTATEFGERIPRMVQRGADKAEEVAVRAERIRNAPPAVQNAIKSNLDDRIINTVTEANPQTVAEYKKMVDLAESSGTKLAPKARPESVAGEAAAQQYKLIDDARAKVGKQIGEAVDTLSKSDPIDVLPLQRQMRDILRQNGVLPMADGRLSFTGKFSPAERTAIQQVYTLALEGGEKLTARQIYDMDRLFSKLQREARFSDIGDIIISTPTGDKSVFSVFRDIFSDTLEGINPEIRQLNREYRKLRTFVDDIEGSIVKSGNFESTKGLDPSKFAQTNLRRILSDAQSAADYREIVAQMDALSRELGYAGANAEELITFAQELRKLYPDTIPATSFSGGIRTGLIDLATDALKAGKPNLKDQQKALRELLESLETRP